MFRPRSSERTLLLAFIVVALSFLGSVAYVRYLSSAIRDAALDIAEILTPRIQRMTSARAELRYLGDVTIAYLDRLAETPAEAEGGAVLTAEDRSAAHQAIVEARLRTREELATYQRLPLLTGEAARRQQLHGAFARLEQSVDHLLGQGALAQDRAARRALRQEYSRASGAVARAMLLLIDFSANQAQGLALRIANDHRRAHIAEILLNLLSLGMTILAATLTLRAARRYGALRDSHNRLLEERASELESFASRVAHDILSPLSNVALTLDILQRATGNDARERSLTRARRSLTRVRRVTEDLFAFARAGAHPAPGVHTPIGEVVEELLHELQSEIEDAQVTLTVAPFPACSVACAHGILYSLLSNLLRNAIKYLSDSEVRHITVRVVPEATVIRVEVADTGPGLPPALLSSVFDAYVRAPGVQQPGLGLGLATVKRLAETHRGRVGVESTLGQGAVFWFELPAAHPTDVSASGER